MIGRILTKICTHTVQYLIVKIVLLLALQIEIICKIVEFLDVLLSISSSDEDELSFYLTHLLWQPVARNLMLQPFRAWCSWRRLVDSFRILQTQVFTLGVASNFIFWLWLMLVWKIWKCANVKSSTQFDVLMCLKRAYDWAIGPSRKIVKERPTGFLMWLLHLSRKWSVDFVLWQWSINKRNCCSNYHTTWIQLFRSLLTSISIYCMFFAGFSTAFNLKML